MSAIIFQFLFHILFRYWKVFYKFYTLDPTASIKIIIHIVVTPEMKYILFSSKCCSWYRVLMAKTDSEKNFFLITSYESYKRLSIFRLINRRNHNLYRWIFMDKLFSYVKMPEFSKNRHKTIKKLLTTYFLWQIKLRIEKKYIANVLQNWDRMHLKENLITKISAFKKKMNRICV